MIAIGSDHGGYELKQVIKNFLVENKFDVEDVGPYNSDPCDYPDIALSLCQKITNKTCHKGILICGTGIGMSIAANKIKGIRAALCSDTFSAKYTVLHNNSNIICIGARVIGSGLALEIIDTFLKTKFEQEPRHMTRINKISEIEKI